MSPSDWEIKPSHPVALELANSHPLFVERARVWQWRQHRPDLDPVPSGWPPGLRGAFGVYDYWYTLIQRSRMHNPYNVPETNTLDEAVALALVLSAADPLIQLATESVPQWLTVSIGGKQEWVRADRVVAWTRFAGSTYDVTLDDDRNGRVDDAAFGAKILNN
jgi:hypothetical protein